MNRLVMPIGCSVLAFLLAASTARAEEVHAYVGTNRCKTCHAREYRSWAATRMAKTFDLLKPGVERSAKLRAKLDPDRDYTVDRNCLPCHTTGYGKPGGFVDAKTTPDLAGVGCEECHGPGASYAHAMTNRRNGKAAFVASGLVSQVSRTQCVACHNADMPVGTVVGSRHFVKQFVFATTKGIHEQIPARRNP